MDQDKLIQARRPVAVLYLARAAEGVDAYRRFLASYRAHPAGVNHDLVVIFKGYQDKVSLNRARSEFSSLPHISIELDDGGFDLGSYFEAAKQLSHRYICCINTFSEILSDHWLSALYQHISRSDVGLVGCTGSYESNSRFVTVAQKAIWLHSQRCKRSTRRQLEKYFGSILPRKTISFSRKCPHILDLTLRDVLRPPYRCCKWCIRNMVGLFRRESDEEMKSRYTAWWQRVQHIGDLAHFCKFPPFPNPHLRTNAFMIRRKQFLSLKRPHFKTKYDACFFESGPESMTLQILQADLRVQIVGCDGKAYDVKDWPRSRTFRLGNQQDLLIQDNQTLAFAEASSETRIVQSLSAWGEENIILPEDFPNLGIRFKLRGTGIDTPPKMGPKKMQKISS